MSTAVGCGDFFSLSEDRVRDGRVFLALLHATDPNRFPYDPSGDATGGAARRRLRLERKKKERESVQSSSSPHRLVRR